MLHRTDWTSTKQIRTDNGNLTLYYKQDGVQYTVVLGDRKQIYWTLLKTSADITDFETTYKSGATSVISLDDAISKILLGQNTDTEIVDAIGNIGLSVALARFRPRFYLTNTEVQLGAADTTLVNISADGKIDSIGLNFSDKKVTLAVIVDNTELFRETLENLDDTSKHNLGQGNVEGFNFKVASGGKTILLHWHTPVDFTTNIQIKANSIDEKKFKAGVIVYREKV